MFGTGPMQQFLVLKYDDHRVLCVMDTSRWDAFWGFMKVIHHLK